MCSPCACLPPQHLFHPEVEPIRKEVCDRVIEAADKGKPPNRIILAGGYSTSPYLQRILKEATKPEKIFSDSRHSRFRNPAYNNWTVDKDPLFTVLQVRTV